MRICIDARMMGPLNTRGPGRYIEELVRAMVKMAPEHTFILLVKDPAASPFQNLPSVEHIKADIPWYGWAEQLYLPVFFEQARADLVHVPHWNVPLGYRGPLVVTIHDLLLRHQPVSAKASTRHPLVAWFKHVGYRLALHHALKQARDVLVPTQFVADDISHLYPYARHKLVVTGEGVTSLPSPDFSLPAPDSFLLYVGSAYPHKRLDLLLDAWPQLSAFHPELHLVIAGEEDAFMARYVSRVKEQGLLRVTFTGRVTDAQLAGLYSRAQALVFPSSFEGFGLPPLEALSLGCPVVASDIACLTEVLPKDGVFFFRNGSSDDMIRAIDALLRQREAAVLAARQAGEWAKVKWTWADAASHTLEAYRSAV